MTTLTLAIKAMAYGHCMATGAPATPSTRVYA